MTKKFKALTQEPYIDGNQDPFINWDVWALDDDGAIIPGRHKTISTPALETRTALSSGGAAVVALLKACAPPGWDNVGLEEALAQEADKQEALSLAATVSDEVEAFVDNIGGFPKEFNV